MKASVFYRAAAVILVLFTVGHTLGFSHYWNFYLAMGILAGVFLLFSALLAWLSGRAGAAPA